MDVFIHSENLCFTQITDLSVGEPAGTHPLPLHRGQNGATPDAVTLMI
ncbi:hypothetical protein A2U01_0069824, partial [Trifolium medium]|nr:hypothetical protein [Trifolium medium]